MVGDVCLRECAHANECLMPSSLPWSRLSAQDNIISMVDRYSRDQTEFIFQTNHQWSLLSVHGLTGIQTTIQLCNSNFEAEWWTQAVSYEQLKYMETHKATLHNIPWKTTTTKRTRCVEYFLDMKISSVRQRRLSPIQIDARNEICIM